MNALSLSESNPSNIKGGLASILVKKKEEGSNLQNSIEKIIRITIRESKEIGNIFGIKGPAVSKCIKAIEVSLDKENKIKKEV